MIQMHNRISNAISLDLDLGQLEVVKVELK